MRALYSDRAAAVTTALLQILGVKVSAERRAAAESYLRDDYAELQQEILRHIPRPF